jgi:hypothetical protein
VVERSIVVFHIYYFRRSGDGGGHEAQVQREDREARRGDEAQVHADQDTQGGAQVVGHLYIRPVLKPMRIRIQLFISVRIRIQGVNPCLSGSGYPRRRSGRRSSLHPASVKTNADPDPAFYLCADPYPGSQSMRIRIRIPKEALRSSRVANVESNEDPDPPFYLYANPDPGCQINVDLDPDQTLVKSQKF